MTPVRCLLWLLVACTYLGACRAGENTGVESILCSRYGSYVPTSPYPEEEVHHNHSSEGDKYTQSAADKGSANNTKVVCRDLKQYPNLTDEVCPQFDEGVVNVTQSLGREAHLSCIVHNLGRFKVAWMRMSTWSILAVQQCIISPNQRISVRVEGKTSTLIIKEVGTDDTGSYMCQINTVPMFSHIFYLDVVVPPTIIEEASSSDMSVREGTDVVLRCAASGLPEPSLTWRREAYRIMEIVNWRNDNASRNLKPGEEPESQIPNNGSIYEGGVMLISKISRAQMAVYLCIASNGVHPAVSRRVMVSVHFPPTLSIPNQLVGTHPGANATLLCTTEAYPRSLNYWTRVKRGVVSDVGHGRRYQVASLSTMYKKYMTLTIFRVVRADYGVYRCHASNSLGTTDGAIRLYDIKDPNGEQDETATEEAPETTPATVSERVQEVVVSRGATLQGALASVSAALLACLMLRRGR